FCPDRDDIIRRLKQLLAAGVRATIVQTTTGPGGIAALVEVEWPKAEDGHPTRISYSQVYVVTDGLVTEIHWHDDIDSAIAAVSRCPRPSRVAQPPSAFWSREPELSTAFFRSAEMSVWASWL